MRSNNAVKKRKKK